MRKNAIRIIILFSFILILSGCYSKTENAGSVSTKSSSEFDPAKQLMCYVVKSATKNTSDRVNIIVGSTSYSKSV